MYEENGKINPKEAEKGPCFKFVPSLFSPRIQIDFDDGFEGLLQVDGHFLRLPVTPGPPLALVGAEDGGAVLAVDHRGVRGSVPAADLVGAIDGS